MAGDQGYAVDYRSDGTHYFGSQETDTTKGLHLHSNLNDDGPFTIDGFDPLLESIFDNEGELIAGANADSAQIVPASNYGFRYLMADKRQQTGMAWIPSPSIDDHFIGASPPAGWTAAVIGAPGALAKVAGETDHPGILSMPSAAASNTGHVIHRGANEILLGNLYFAFQFRIRLSFGATQVLRLGFFDSLGTGADVDAFAFEISGATTLRGMASNNSVVTNTGTSYGSAAVDTWYLAWARWIGVNVEFKICDVAGVVLWSDTIATSALPTGAGRTLTFGAKHYTTNTAAKTLEIDRVCLWLDNNAAMWPQS